MRVAARVQERTQVAGASVRECRRWAMDALASVESPSDVPSPSTGRYEFKYLIRAERIQEIANFLSKHLDLDKFGATRLRDSYTVRSVYFDSPAFRCYHEKASGEKNRRKYRLRSYNDEKHAPILLECKQRRGETYTKRKMRLGNREIEALRHRAGFDASVENLKGVYAQLLLSMDRWQYAPAALVVYDRIAYVTPGQQDTIRVTFDRNLRASLFPELEDIHDEAELIPLLYGWTIFEVKFNDVVPPFLGRLTAAFDLQRQACSKYAISIASLLGENPTKKEGWNHVCIL